MFTENDEEEFWLKVVAYRLIEFRWSSSLSYYYCTNVVLRDGSDDMKEVKNESIKYDIRSIKNW